MVKKILNLFYREYGGLHKVRLDFSRFVHSFCGFWHLKRQIAGRETSAPENLWMFIMPLSKFLILFT